MQASRRRIFVRVWLGAGLAIVGGFSNGAQAESSKRDKNTKYYFKIVEVVSDTSAENIAMAREILARELYQRPEFVTDLPAVVATAEVPGQQKKTGLRGFEVSLRIESLTSKLLPPRPGGRLNQLEVAARVGVYGSEIPSRELVFSGEGDALQVVEFYETRRTEEERAIVEDVLTDAIRQAVDQATQKLALSTIQPVTGNKRPRGLGAKKRTP